MNLTAESRRAKKQKLRQAMRRQIEETYSGYLETDDKLHVMVQILTGLRILYSLFYLAMTCLYGMPLWQALMNLAGPVFFYLWYIWMLYSGKGTAVLMLLFRGVSLVYGSVAALEMSFWLPYPLIFMLTLALLMEFVEAVFCIYILFNSENAKVIRLNKELEFIVRNAGECSQNRSERNSS